MNEAVIVSTARTGLAKSWKGAFNMTHGATLGAHAVYHAVARSGLDPSEVEDCIMGGTFGEGTTGGNIARAIALRAGLPVTTGGVSVNRFCSSGLQTIAMAAQRVILEGAPAIVAGGVESISCVQIQANTHMGCDPWLVEHKPELYWGMVQTAETVAKRYGITREAQDAYGVRSQPRDRPGIEQADKPLLLEIRQGTDDADGCGNAWRGGHLKHDFQVAVDKDGCFGGRIRGVRRDIARRGVLQPAGGGRLEKIVPYRIVDACPYRGSVRVGAEIRERRL